MEGFWQALERFGVKGAAACEWQRVLGDDWEAWRPFLRETGTCATWMSDPSAPHRHLSIEPDGESGFIALDDDGVHSPIMLDRSEVVALAIDWKSLAVWLGGRLDFAADTWETKGCCRRVGTGRHSKGPARPVLLCLPPSQLGANAGVLAELLRRENSVVLLPTNGMLSPDLTKLGSSHDLEFIVLAEQSFELDAPPVVLGGGGKKLAAKREVEPLFRPQSGWKWEMLGIYVASSGRLIFTCGGQRKEHQLAKSNGRNHSELYEIFAGLAGQAAKGELPMWQNPRSGEYRAERHRKRFQRVVELLEDLIQVPGKPFHRRKDRIYVPKFTIGYDRDLDERRIEIASSG